MSPRNGSPELPQPPWSYAPSEVAEWLASTARPTRRRGRRVGRAPARVKGFFGRFPLSEEEKLLRRLAGSDFHPMRRLRGALARFSRRPPGRSFAGRLRDVDVEVDMRKKDLLEVRVMFGRPIDVSRATRLLTELRLRPSSGQWL